MTDTPHNTPPPSQQAPLLFPDPGRGGAGGAIAYGIYWLLYSRYFESTDDAYVGGNVVAVTSKENATVMALHADNTQTVSAWPAAARDGPGHRHGEPAGGRGQPGAGGAQCARRILQVRVRSTPSWRRPALVLSQAQDDYQPPLRGRGWTGRCRARRLAHARDAVAVAQAQVNSAQGGLQQSHSSISRGTDVAHNPDVLAAEAQLRSAAIVFGHMRIVAPLDGVIAQRTVQAGQQVAAGTPLMAVVPLERCLDRRQLQGSATGAHAGGPAGDGDGRHLWRQRHLPWPSSKAWARAAARPLRCCRRRMPAATGSRSCSGCRCASPWTRRNCTIIPCAWA